MRKAIPFFPRIVQLYNNKKFWCSSHLLKALYYLYIQFNILILKVITAIIFVDLVQNQKKLPCFFRGVAQFGRVRGLGPRCRRFEFCRPDHFLRFLGGECK